MKNKEFGKELEIRTKKFALSVIILSASMPNNIENYIIKKQVVKSGTSIGANYREANHSRSKADFINKIRICEGEASETMYWLEIIRELKNIDLETLSQVAEEASAILSIFTAIGYKLRMSNKPF